MTETGGKRRRTEATEARRFAIVLAILLAALTALSIWRGHRLRAEILGGVALASLICAFLVRPLWIRFFRVWMKFAEALSWVSTRVILSAVFFIVITPYGLVSRLFRKDPLDLSWKSRKPSYWVDKAGEPPDPQSYERQY